MIVTPETAKEILLDATNILVLITGAMSPDGDSIGSSLGLTEILQKTGKNVDVCSTLVIPRKLDFIVGDERVEVSDPAKLDLTKYDLVVVPDTSDESLAADKSVNQHFAFPEGVQTMSIDHHSSSQDWAAYSLINSTASSASEIVANLFHEELKGDRSASFRLLSGIVTDTGGFRYNIFPGTLHTAGDLLANGADIKKITDSLNRYQPDTLIGLELIKKGIENLAWDKSHQFTYTFISIRDIFHLGGTPQHMRENSGQVVNRFSRSLHGAQFGATFIEVDRGINDVELRGNRNSPYDLASIATQLGGGGHHNAAGYTVQGELGDVINKFMSVMDTHKN